MCSDLSRSKSIKATPNKHSIWWDFMTEHIGLMLMFIYEIGNYQWLSIDDFLWKCLFLFSVRSSIQIDYLN